MTKRSVSLVVICVFSLMASSCVTSDEYFDDDFSNYPPSSSKKKTETCEGDPCEGATCLWGTCESNDNCEPVCVCHDGYTGEECRECADAYHVEGLECVPDRVQQDVSDCGVDVCSGHGVEVNDGDGITYCDCFTGYTGEICADCMAGYEQAGDDCVPRSAQDPDPCGDHGVVSVNGEKQYYCQCDEGYSGDKCGVCDRGYVRDGEVCINPCQFYDCGEHGTCKVEGAKPACDCSDGWGETVRRLRREL